MEIRCIWEHNGNDTLLYSANFIGAFSRGESKKVALSKMEDEVKAYLRWKSGVTADLQEKVNVIDSFEITVSQEKVSTLDICDADSDVIFNEEKGALTLEEYTELKKLVLKSAEDFLKLYEAVPDKNKSVIPHKKTFLGERPRTAYEMYEHTKSVNTYYFGEIGVDADNEGTIYECRKSGVELLERQENFLKNPVIVGSYDEEWSLRKVFRRFLWHDRIHAKAMYRMAVKTFGEGSVPDVFRFEK